ncbi:hypothetical protein C817_01255 [Dorea sp. 5-2]|nr:hypothetical protein C817_01255 [Dorea sp. 5-2]
MNSQEKKRIQRNRMLGYFTAAAIEIIEAEGLEGLTIRKVADKAGYNSATLYHYFDNLDHLTFFAAIHYLKDYASDLAEYLPAIDDSIEAYLKVWEYFCRRSYERPAIYKLLFFQSFDGIDLDEAIKTYYEIFPDEITQKIQDYSPMLTEANIYKREFIALNKALKSKNIHIDEKDLYSITEMNVLIYRGMLSEIKEQGHLRLNIEEAVAHTVEYMKHSLTSYGIPVK